MQVRLRKIGCSCDCFVVEYRNSKHNRLRKGQLVYETSYKHVQKRRHGTFSTILK